MRAALLKVTGYREKQEIGRGSLCSGHLVTQTGVVVDHQGYQIWGGQALSRATYILILRVTVTM